MSTSLDITPVRAVEFDRDHSQMLLALVNSGADPVDGLFLAGTYRASVARSWLRGCRRQYGPQKEARPELWLA